VDAAKLLKQFGGPRFQITSLKRVVNGGSCRIEG
jgi:hypothetical protein